MNENVQLTVNLSQNLVVNGIKPFKHDVRQTVVHSINQLTEAENISPSC